MNQIYWVNASLKSVSPINGMAYSVPVTDFDAFDIGEPAPAALPSPPSIPIPLPQPGTSQTQPEKRSLLLHVAASSRWRPKRKNRNRRMMMEGMKVQVPKRKSLPKNKELVFMNPVTSFVTGLQTVNMLLSLGSTDRNSFPDCLMTYPASSILSSFSTRNPGAGCTEGKWQRGRDHEQI